MSNEIVLKEVPFTKKLLRIALPISFQYLMLAAVAAADALMLGHFNQNSMAAVSLASQVQFIQNMFIAAVISIEGILGAQYWGKKDGESLNKIFAIAIKMNVIIDLVFWAICLFIPKQLMSLLTDQKILIEIGARYLTIASWSYLITGISQCYHAMMKVSDHPARTATISACTVLINIILNALLIFGLFGLPAMGVDGAAYATLISRIIELIWCVANSYRKNYIHLRIKSFFKKAGNIFLDYIKLMLPILGASLLWGAGFASYSVFMGHLGLDAVAANSVASVIRDLLCCFCNGLSSAAAVVIGNELGAGNLSRGKEYGDKILKIAFIMGAVITFLLLALTPLLTQMVTLTDGARFYLSGMLFINAFYMYGRTFNTIIINGVIDAGGDTSFDLYSLTICMWCLAIPFAILGTFVFHWPVLLVYACTCIDEVGKIPWVIGRYKKYIWVKDLTR